MDYSRVSMATMNRDINLYTEAVKCVRMLIYLAVVVTGVILMFGCFIAAFLEIAKLKSKASFEQLPPSEQASVIMSKLQQINLRVSSIKERFREFEITGNLQLIDWEIEVQQLKISLDMISEQTNTRFYSIEDRLREAENTNNNRYSKVQVLNTTVNMQLTQLLTPGLYTFHPASSCAALPPSFPSGYYWVRASNRSAVYVYCDMTRSCGGVTGGWRRVVELDMTNSSHRCPSDLNLRIDSNNRTCVRNFSPGCSSDTFSSATLEYSRVCGKIIAYLWGTPDTFRVFLGHYVDGISLTHGNPRQHIWTFAAGRDCPCNTDFSSGRQSPAFVGNEYFCDSHNERQFTLTFYGADPLWDGAGCEPPNTCCSFNNPPWFYKQLPQPTTDDIEMRVCRDQSAFDEDFAIESLDIYVH